jgi:hypothetical protein
MHARIAAVVAVDGIETPTQPTVPTVRDDATPRTSTRRPRCQWQRDGDGRLRMRWR